MSQQRLTESRVRFQEGLQRLQQCQDDDTVYLGSALISFHGAIEFHFRDVLLKSASLSEQDRITVSGSRGVQKSGWLTLLAMMQQHFDLPENDRRVFSEYNNLRNKVAHGESLHPGEITRSQVQEYADLVGNWLARSWPISQPKRSTPRPSSQSFNSRPGAYNNSRTNAYSPKSDSPKFNPQRDPYKAISGVSWTNSTRTSTSRTSTSRTSLPKKTPVSNADWMIANIQALLTILCVTIVGYFVVLTGGWGAEAYRLIPKGSAGGIAGLGSVAIGLCCYFHCQGIQLVKKTYEWTIVSLIGIGMICIPALLLGVGSSSFIKMASRIGSPLLLMTAVIFGISLGLVLGIAQYKLLQRHYQNAAFWILASMGDWILCCSFFPLLKFLRPELGKSLLASFLIPLLGFVLGKGITVYQARRMMR